MKHLPIGAMVIATMLLLVLPLLGTNPYEAVTWKEGVFAIFGGATFLHMMLVFLLEDGDIQHLVHSSVLGFLASFVAFLMLSDVFLVPSMLFLYTAFSIALVEKEIVTEKIIIALVAPFGFCLAIFGIIASSPKISYVSEDASVRLAVSGIVLILLMLIVHLWSKRKVLSEI